MPKTQCVHLPIFKVNKHYTTVSRSIEFIRANAQQQPSLAEISTHVGISPQHLSELFHDWAGISPKQFLKAITLKHAKQLLLKDYSTVETSFECGLSGNSRLYDLFVTVEAMTPGEYKMLGKGITLSWGIHMTPFGKAMIVASERGMTHLYFPGQEETKEQLLQKLAINWPLAKIVANESITQLMAESIFFGKPTLEPLRLLLKGSPFQLKVWQALLDIKQGDTSAYSTVAKKIGNASAHRACATAIGDNPISYLIPCHRVLRKSMELGGYRWGLNRKCAILGTELAIKKTQYNGKISNN